MAATIAVDFPALIEHPWITLICAVLATTAIFVGILETAAKDTQNSPGGK